MRPALTLTAALLAVIALPLGAAAQGKSIELPADHAYGALKTAPGVEVAERSCRSCHSTDYVVMQPPGDAKQWDGVVTKMIKVFGANIPPEDAKAVVEYLSAAYGR